jgi:hypothetical protein
MLTITIMFMLILCIMLICHASILYMLNLIHQYVMIYILVLIWKLPNSLTATALHVPVRLYKSTHVGLYIYIYIYI